VLESNGYGVTAAEKGAMNCKSSTVAASILASATHTIFRTNQKIHTT
jgi:hypothetical protein